MHLDFGASLLLLLLCTLLYSLLLLIVPMYAYMLLLRQFCRLQAVQMIADE
jgi:ABC-type polysaccharide transport system permease subunit